jgi:nitrate/nitrite-specific signal transduction histidine kinase
MKNPMSILAGDSIRLRLIFTMVSSVIFVFLIISVVIIYQNAKAIEAQLDKRMMDASNLAGKNLPSALWQYNNDYVSDFAESLFLYEDIIYVRVLSGNEVIIEKNNSNFKEKHFQFFKQSSRFSTTDANIDFEGKTIGNIQIVMTNERIKKVILYNSTMAIISILLVISVIVITFYLISKKYILTPLSKLENSAVKIAGGNWDTHIDTSGTDEIGNLSKTFDQMIKKLKASTASRVELEQEIRERKKTEKQRDKIILDLQEALSEVKTLSGLLPICSHCKKIRDDKGYWNQIEAYIGDHSDAEFSHSICQECAEKYFPEMGLYDEDETQQ